MSGEYLLDTNIVIALTVHDRAVLQRLEEDVTVFLPSIVLGELFFGAYRSGRVEQNLEQVAELAANNTVLACDGATARHYGRIKQTLREAGRPIPENDVWICALASQHDLSVASRDVHFREVEGIVSKPGKKHERTVIGHRVSATGRPLDNLVYELCGRHRRGDTDSRGGGTLTSLGGSDLMLRALHSIDENHAPL